MNGVTLNPEPPLAEEVTEVQRPQDDAGLIQFCFLGEELFPPGNSPARDLFFFHEELFSALGTPGRAGFNPLPCCRSEFKEFPAAGKAGKAAGLKVGEPREVPAVGIPGCCARTPWNCRDSTTPEPSNSAANNSHLHPPGAPPEKKSTPAPNPIF